MAMQFETFAIRWIFHLGRTRVELTLGPMRDLAVGGCEKWELVSILRNSKNLKRVAICSNRDAL